jgi:hypothetical protein
MKLGSPKLEGFLSFLTTEMDSNSPIAAISTAYVIQKREYCYEEGSFRGALLDKGRW